MRHRAKICAWSYTFLVIFKTHYKILAVEYRKLGQTLRARVLHHCQFRLMCRHEQAKLCGREQLKCLCAAWSWDVGHSCRRALLCGTLFLCLSPPVPPPPLFSLALTLISSLINIVLVSDLQQRRRLYISFELLTILSKYIWIIIIIIIMIENQSTSQVNESRIIVKPSLNENRNV